MNLAAMDIRNQSESLWQDNVIVVFLDNVKDISIEVGI